MELDGLQLATLAGTLLGSMAGSYFVATRATKRRLDSEPPPVAAPLPPAPRLSETDVGPDLKLLLAKIEGLERELRQEVRSLETKITQLSGEALTVEEFQAYVTVDSGRREQLVAKLGELQGSLAALFPRMRK